MNAIDARSAAFVAVTRFGLGPERRALARASADPRGYVLAQLDPGAPSPAAFAGLASREALAAEWKSALDAFRKARRAMREAGADGPERAALEAAFEAARRDRIRFIGSTFRAEAMARVEAAIASERPLLERLVRFWSNHFAVSVNALAVRLMAGERERGAIRPQVLGRFEDLLKAAVLHPAMLAYLDNTASFGPGSRIGRRRGRSFNENLAREVLELHTLGVDGGYTQEDVRALALVLTGWRGEHAARRAFVRNAHEPGPKTVLGRTYRRDGPGQALAVLSDLARHPATARHVCGKLARHFTGDVPPPGLAGRLEAVWRETDGDLLAVTTALVTDEAAWTAPPAKFVPPYDFAVSVWRGLDRQPPLRDIRRGLKILGQELWEPPAPTGWPDGDEAWLGGDALLERLDFADQVAREVAPRVAEPVPFARGLLGRDMSADLETALTRAESRRQALALLVMSAEWQRR